MHTYLCTCTFIFIFIIKLNKVSHFINKRPKKSSLIFANLLLYNYFWNLWANTEGRNIGKKDTQEILDYLIGIRDTLPLESL